MTGQQGSREEKHEGEEKRSLSKVSEKSVGPSAGACGNGSIIVAAAGSRHCSPPGFSGTVLFRQKRVGRNGQYFYIYKFRTMRIDTPHDMPTHLLNHPDLFITRVGRFLRKTSLDELPQLFNILKGDMALVGPRPALWNQEDLISEREQYGANSVRPGLTGWAQIHGRDELPIREKAELDGYYVHHIALGMDLECLCKTAGAVLRQDGIHEGMMENRWQ